MDDFCNLPQKILVSANCHIEERSCPGGSKSYTLITMYGDRLNAGRTYQDAQKAVQMYEGDVIERRTLNPTLTIQEDWKRLCEKFQDLKDKYGDCNCNDQNLNTENNG